MMVLREAEDSLTHIHIQYNGWHFSFPLNQQVLAKTMARGWVDLVLQEVCFYLLRNKNLGSTQSSLLGFLFLFLFLTFTLWGGFISKYILFWVRIPVPRACTGPALQEAVKKLESIKGAVCLLPLPSPPKSSSLLTPPSFKIHKPRTTPLGPGHFPELLLLIVLEGPHLIVYNLHISFSAHFKSTLLSYHGRNIYSLKKTKTEKYWKAKKKYHRTPYHFDRTIIMIIILSSDSKSFFELQGW